MSRPGPTFYVFHGEDEFTCAETVADLRRRMASSGMADLNVLFLDGRAVRLDELRHACEAIPFLSDRRMVVVTGLLERLGRDRGRFLEGLLEMLPRLPETTRLVLVEHRPLPDDHPVVARAREHERGYVRRSCSRARATTG